MLDKETLARLQDLGGLSDAEAERIIQEFHIRGHLVLCF